MTGLSDFARGRFVWSVVVGIQRRDKYPLAIGAAGHCHRLIRRPLAGAHFVGSRRRPDWMPPGHCDSPLRHGTRWILLGNLRENPARLLIKE